MKFHIVLTALLSAVARSSYTPENVMVDVTNDFGTCILKLVATRGENVAFSPYGLVSVSLVLYEGANGPTAAEIHNSLRLPWDTQVTRIGFRDLHRYLKSYFTNDGFLRGLVLSKANVILRRNYTNQLEFYGFDFKSERPTAAPPENGSTTSSQTPSPGTTLVPVSTLTPPARTTTSESPATTAAKPGETTPAVTTTEGKEVEGKDMEAEMPGQTTTLTPTTETKVPDNVGAAGMPAPVGGEATTVDVSVVKTTVSMTVTAAVNPTTAPVETLPPVTTTETTPAATAPPPPETTVAPTTLPPTTLPPTTLPPTTVPPTTLPPVTLPPTTVPPTTVPPTTVPPTTVPPTTLPPTTVPPTTLPPTTLPPTTIQTEAPTTAATTESAPAETTATVAVATQLPPAAETDNVASESQLVTRKERALYSKGYVSGEREGIPNWVPHYQDPRLSQQNTPRENWFFTPSGGERVPVVTYTAYLPFAYISEIATLALQVPLDDPRYYMMIMLPEERDGLEKLLYSLQWCSIRGIVNQLKTTAVYATIPSFTIVKHINLLPAMVKMGIVRVFDPARADLSAMSSEPGLYVRTIEQVVTVSLRKYFANHRWFDASPSDVEQHFIANHPFAYFVLDRETQVTLMAGTIINPIAHPQ